MTETVGEVDVGMTVSLSVPVSLAMPRSYRGVRAWVVVKVDTAGGLMPSKFLVVLTAASSSVRSA
jgi:hypothetical protein